MWGFVFLMFVMKVPILYLLGVVWYACKSPPPPEPALKVVEEHDPKPPCPWQMRRRNPDAPRRPRVPPRRTLRPARAAHSFAERR